MFRRSAITAGVLAAAGALLVSTAGSASADVSLPIGGLPVGGLPVGGGLPVPSLCTVAFHTPATVSLSTAYPTIPVTMSVSGTLCPVTTAVLSGGAQVTVVSPSGSRAVASFASATDTARASVHATTTGSFSLTGGRVSLVDGVLGLPIQVDKITYSTTRAKFATRSDIGGKRTGRTYTFTGYVKRYDPVHLTWTGTAGRTVYLQKRTSRGWQNMKKVSLSASGSLRVKISGTGGQYRWSTSETSNSWAVSSRTVGV